MATADASISPQAATPERVASLVDRCHEISGWDGVVWRAHVHGFVRGKLRRAGDYEYTRGTEGRWRLGGPDVAEADRFPAFYASLVSHVAEVELLRHLDQRRRREGARIDLRHDHFRLTQMEVRLARVLDVPGIEPSILSRDALCLDEDYVLPRPIATDARRRGAEALLVWSCAVDPPCSQRNLVVFPDRFLPGSSLHETDLWTELRPLP